MNSRRLFNVFEAYTGGDKTMTSAKFLKLMKDATLLDDSSFKQSDVDIIFTKNKEKGQRTINYDGFKQALEMVAGKKQVSSKDLAEFIILKCSEGPSLTEVTQAKETRFYDDKSLYTGVHKAGGPTTVDKEKQGLHQLLDRSSADVRGLKKEMKEAHHRDVNTPPAASGKRTTNTSRTPGGPVPQTSSSVDLSSPSHEPQERHTHVSTPLSGHSSSALSGHSSSALSGHSSSALSGHSSSALDEAALLGSLEKRLQKTSLGSSAQPQQQSQQQHHHHLEQQQQQQYTPNVFTSSQSLTPSFNMPPPPQQYHLSQQPIHTQYSQQQTSTQHSQLPPPSASRQTPNPHQQAGQQKSVTVQQQPQDDENQLFHIYKSFCVNQETFEMDSSRFVKLCKDAGFVTQGYLTTTDADLIFQKTKRSGNYGKRICYEDFRMVAISEMAKRMQCSPDDVISQIIQIDGPSFNNVTTTAEVRFHDDVSTYTGVKSKTGGVNPSFAVENSTITMESLLDRSEADARGVKKTPGSGGSKQRPQSQTVVMAGEANKKGGIFDRLTNQSSYTGVYKERTNPDATGLDSHYDISQLVNRR